MKIYDKAKDIPKEWDEFCIDNFYMSREKLEFFEKVNNCNQKYYMVYNENDKIEACFVMFPFKYEFSKRIKLNVQLIFLPASVADPGIVAKPNSKALADCLKKIKGIKLILSTSEDFKLLNGIRQEGLPNCMLNVKWDTMEEYKNSMRNNYRKNINKVIKKQNLLSKRIITNPKEFTKETHDLYLQVMNHADYVLETLNLDFFQNNFSKTIVLELENEPKAFVQFAEDGEKIIGEFCGFDYEDREKYDLYNIIMVVFIQYAIENGFKIIDIGQSAYRTKLRYGAYLEPKYSWLFYNGNKICNAILKYILLKDNNNKPIYNYNVFREENQN